MRTLIVMPVPTREGGAEEASVIKARIQGIYGKGQGTLDGKAINGSDIEAAMGTSRDPAELKEMWTSLGTTPSASRCARITRSSCP